MIDRPNSVDDGPFQPEVECGNVISTADTSAEPISFHQLENAMHVYRKEAALTGTRNLSAWSDAVAFGVYSDVRGLEPWGAYFGPQGSGATQDGRKVYFPEVRELDARALDLWAFRLANVAHPALRARYADLLWEFSSPVANRKRDVQHARMAIIAYEEMAVQGRHQKFFSRSDSALRMLSLALTIRDQPAVVRARELLICYHREAAKGPDRIDFSVIDQLLWERGIDLPPNVFDELISDLERLLDEATSPGPTFDAHLGDLIASRLRRHYSRQKSQNALKSVHARVGSAFEALAGLGSAMAASSHFDKAATEYARAGDREAHDRVRILRAKAVEDSRGEMSVHSAEITITSDDMEDFLASVVDDDAVMSLLRIAILFPGIEEMRRLVLSTAESAPIQAFISISIHEDEHVAAIVGSVQDDIDGRIMHMAGQALAFDSIQLQAALTRLLDRHHLTAYDIAGWAGRLGAYEDLSVITEGVEAWFEGDWVKCLHVLVPQIEAGLRRTLKDLDQPIVRDHPTMPGRQILLNMGEVLSSAALQEAMGDDLVFYFRARYVDPRARNLRNSVAHGLVGAGDASSQTCDMLIHSLIVLGCWREVAQYRRGKNRDASASPAATPSV